jgi:2-dehydropantoate 2-reductase
MTVSPTPNHTVVLGPGALGCFLAAELARAGRRVTLVDHRAGRAQRLAASGISVTDERGEQVIAVAVTAHGRRACADTGVLATADLLLVCVKAHATPSVADALQGRCREGVAVCTVQNGLGNVECLREALPHASVLAGVTYFGSCLLGEGRVVATPRRRMLLGADQGAAAALIGQEFAPTTVRLESVPDIDQALWRKAIVNAVINPLTAIHGVANGELPALPDAMDTAGAVVHEAVAVAATRAHAFVEQELLEAVVQTCRATATNISSMRQDIEAGRATEIDAINGAIVRAGEQAGVPCPVNAGLVAQIVALAKT